VSKVVLSGNSHKFRSFSNYRSWGRSKRTIPLDSKQWVCQKCSGVSGWGLDTWVKIW